MKAGNDTIQFEYKSEIREVMMMVDKYISQNPKEKENKTIERFFDLLDLLDMYW